MARNGHSVKHDVNDIFRQSGIIQINSDVTRSDETRQAIEAGYQTKHEIAGQTGIHQSETLHKYKSVVTDFFHFCRAGGMGRDYKTYTADDVRAYMMTKLEDGKSLNTIQGIGSALNKLDNMLNKLDGGSRDFSGVIAEVRGLAIKTAPQLDLETRRFNDPHAVINAMSDDRCKLAATIQLETGLRKMNVCKIILNGDGTLNVKSKAGYRDAHFQISPTLYSKLEEYANDKGRVYLTNYDHYVYELKKACFKVGENYTGTHAFRHNFAQNLYTNCRNGGMSDAEAKAVVSKALFHDRLDIVDKYLR